MGTSQELEPQVKLTAYHYFPKGRNCYCERQKPGDVTMNPWLMVFLRAANKLKDGGNYKVKCQCRLVGFVLSAVDLAYT